MSLQPVLKDLRTWSNVEKDIDLATSLRAKLGKPDLVMALVESFGIPEHMQHSPIAKDWVKYNAIENFKEHTEEYCRKEIEENSSIRER